MSDMLSRSVSMLERLVAFDTTSRLSNLELIDYARDYLEEMGIPTRTTFNEDGTKANLWATIGPEDKGGVVLSGHVDVVPVDGQDWSHDPFKMWEADGKYFGRGTADMKGFCAIALAMAPEMKKRNLKTPIHFAFSYDEEVGCIGVRGLIKDMAENLPLPTAVIVGEPTGMKIIGGNKGSRGLMTTIRGIPGHSSEPHRGVNSIMYGARIINLLETIQKELRENPYEDSPFDPPYTTIDLGIIEGGTAHNIIPEFTKFRWGMRIHPGDDGEAIEQRVRDYIENELNPEMKAFSPDAGITMELVNVVPPLIPDTDSAAEELVRYLTGLNQSGAVSFGTEAGFFQEAGVPGVIFGPGYIQQAHQPDEFIERSQVQECVDFMSKLTDWAADNG
ncbi:MAG: acetylornithine deacetylase [Nisaea sp.]|uniref:acetylornithine deacetylase n=1 Tax=Nisaea sp. TaxID=2024842 RepID=UPI001B21C824|nr:acetylornithine deacetylase [Nisaea sp.]MBO6561397.1 acetylornithine deacetylase [Nisaea sp.]